jgi:bloom syndrome protein
VTHLLHRLLFFQTKLLYVTPEKLSHSTQLNSILQKLHASSRLSRFVVDEAHCLCDWGHDFRPEYLQLDRFRVQFPGVPLMALTATATADMVADVAARLGMGQSYRLFQMSFDRPNLHYSIRPKKTKNSYTAIALQILNEHTHGSGIVYTGSRKTAEDITDVLLAEGISASFYHAAMESEERTRVQHAWCNDETRVIVATAAFGMGVSA